jgi:hypothetical protein
MAIIMNPAPGATGAPDRGQAIKQIIAARESAKVSTEARNEPESPPAAEVESKPDPEHLIEIERRERALDQLKHELAMRDSELERFRSAQNDGKDWKKLLASNGHSVEQIVQEWLSDDSAKAPPTQPPSVSEDTKSEYGTRLEQLERRLAEEDGKRQREARLAEIRSMTPEGDDYEVTNAMGWHELVMSNLDGIAKREKRAIGPQETAKLIRDFESQSRSQLEKDIGRLAKTKYGRNIIKQLLTAESTTASEPNEAETPTPSDEHNSGASERTIRLRLQGSDTREQAKKRALSRLR